MHTAVGVFQNLLVGKPDNNLTSINRLRWRNFLPRDKRKTITNITPPPPSAPQTPHFCDGLQSTHAESGKEWPQRSTTRYCCFNNTIIEPGPLEYRLWHWRCCQRDELEPAAARSTGCSCALAVVLRYRLCFEMQRDIFANHTRMAFREFIRACPDIFLRGLWRKAPNMCGKSHFCHDRWQDQSVEVFPSHIHKDLVMWRWPKNNGSAATWCRGLSVCATGEELEWRTSLFVCKIFCSDSNQSWMFNMNFYYEENEYLSAGGIKIALSLQLIRRIWENIKEASGSCVCVVGPFPCCCL